MALEELVVHEKKVMLQEIATQPDFVRDSIDGMLATMRNVLASREPGTLRHGFMIGCGDSYCAALAARSYMMEATGRFVEAVEALEFSRYLVVLYPARDRSSSASRTRAPCRAPSRACGSPASAAPGPLR